MSHPQLITKLLETLPIEQWQASKVVIGVSGGADSVALLRAMHSIAVTPDLLHVAHFNHGWRGQESDDDEQFVIELCQSLGVSYTVGTNIPSTTDDRSEQTARIERYRFLCGVAENRSSKIIATAHTASDRVETMLHNLCRGTGLAGVSTPTVYRTLDDRISLARPIVYCFREEVLEYLTLLSQPYREDSSNENQSYRRNFIRHSVLPLLRQVYGDSVDDRLLSYSQLAEQSLRAQQDLAVKYWDDAQELEIEKIAEGWLPRSSFDQICLPSAAELYSPWPIVLLALQQNWQSRGWKQQSLTRRHWQRMRQHWEQLQTPAKKRLRKPRRLFELPGGVEVYSLNGWLILTKMGI